jgi:hypothetical protein
LSSVMIKLLLTDTNENAAILGNKDRPPASRSQQ